MTDKPNFVMIRDDASPVARTPHHRGGGMLVRLRKMVDTALSMGVATATARLATLGNAEPPAETRHSGHPRLVFAVDATASREPAWTAARRVTDALVKALPGELEVALAVHGGSRVHTFTGFTHDAATLRDRAAGVGCEAGATRMLPILSASLKQAGVRVVIYIGDVFEESVLQGRRVADAMGAQGIKLIVLHDTSDPAARRDAEVFWDLAKRTGGCVLPFDAGASQRLRDLVSAVAVYAVGGEKLLRQRRDMPGAVALLDNLGKGR